MSTLSYCGFGQEPADKPVDEVHFSLEPSVGNVFAQKLSGYQQAWKFDGGQVQRFYPLYEEVRECQIFCVRAGYGLPSGRPYLYQVGLINRSPYKIAN
jgi:hypothetical protein